jgi:hypothetical protein
MIERLGRCFKSNALGLDRSQRYDQPLRGEEGQFHRSLAYRLVALTDCKTHRIVVVFIVF